ncbi:hypothetical protein B2J93_9326 [Marssonina coronariae]|uniref:Major facilitator superfamily (MFS) profile domain-containing protein n=1 Tax=Diplocarpon coronariae TaxID=2795749 RepID=A0A218Z8E7_9HELO|nr:hypothetical protein B2J93_9326 [Marssonina coronariae]
MFANKSIRQSRAAGPDIQAVLPEDALPWYKTRHLVRLNLILLVPLFSSSTVGYDTAMMNSLQALPQWQRLFGDATSSLPAFVNAIYPIGKLLGLFPATWISDRYGRRRPMHFGFLMLMIGAAFQGGAESLPMFIIARLFLGLATSLISLPSPVLVAELAYPTHRGKLTALYNTFYYFGAVLAAWCTYGSFDAETSWAWRMPSLMQALFPFLQFLCFFFVPESPRWLVANDRHADARKILVTHHAGGDEASPLVDFQMAEMEDAIRGEKATMSQGSFAQCLQTSANRRRAFIALTLGIFAQWSGNGVVAYYLAPDVRILGVRRTSLQMLIGGLLLLFDWFVAVFAGAMLVDRVGRRPLLLVSVAGMLITYMAWTAINHFLAPDSHPGANYAILACTFVYFLFYNVGWDPLLWAYPIEIFPYTLRCRGLTITLASAYLGSIIGHFCNPIATKQFGWIYFVVFCALLALLLGIVYSCFPETRGFTLEGIVEVFEGPRERVGSGLSRDMDVDRKGSIDEDGKISEELRDVVADREGRFSALYQGKVLSPERVTNQSKPGSEGAREVKLHPSPSQNRSQKHANAKAEAEAGFQPGGEVKTTPSAEQNSAQAKTPEFEKRGSEKQAKRLRAQAQANSQTRERKATRRPRPGFSALGNDVADAHREGGFRVRGHRGHLEAMLPGQPAGQRATRPGVEEEVMSGRGE